MQPALCLHIPRGSFHQAPGRQRSSIPLPAHSPLLLRHSSLPFASLQTPKTPKTLRGSFHQASRGAACSFLAVSVPSLQPALCLHIALSCYGIRACRLPAFKPLKPLKPSAAASTKPGSQPLLLQGCSLPFPARQRSSIAACPLPAHSPLLLGHSSLPFARLQTLTTPNTTPETLHIPRGSFHQAPGRQRSSIPLPAHSPLLLRHWRLPFASLQTPKTPKTLRGSFHQASRVAACPFLAVSVPSLQPALCLHIALSCYGIRACRLPAFKPLKPLKPSAAASTKPGRQPLLLQGCSLPFPGRQRSSIAACPLPAHSPLLLRHSSLPFASLQTPKTPQTLRGSFHQASRVAACPFLAVSVPSLQPALCLHLALSCYGIRACRLPAFKPLKPLKPSAAASTKLLAVSVPASLCLHIALSCYGIRACRLPAFKPLKPLKPSAAASTTPPGLQPALSWPSAFHHCSLPFACT